MEPFGQSAAVLAEACGVDISTARKWRRAKRVPPQYHRWLKFYFGHDLGAFAKGWEGWHMREGALWSPEGDSFTPGRVRAIPRTHDLCDALKQENAELVSTINADNKHKALMGEMETLLIAVKAANDAVQAIMQRLSRRERQELTDPYGKFRAELQAERDRAYYTARRARHYAPAVVILSTDKGKGKPANWRGLKRAGKGANGEPA